MKNEIPLQCYLRLCLLYFYSRFGDSRINMFTESNLWILAVISILALLGVFIAQAIMVPQSAEARGCRTSVAFNASQGRCFHS